MRKKDNEILILQLKDLRQFQNKKYQIEIRRKFVFTISGDGSDAFVPLKT
jgi:hypothetical protein